VRARSNRPVGQLVRQTTSRFHVAPSSTPRARGKPAFLGALSSPRTRTGRRLATGVRNPNGTTEDRGRGPHCTTTLPVIPARQCGLQK
jgi:hypothetical protein